MEERERVILFPVRRRLAVLCSAYLSGHLWGADRCGACGCWFGILCAFLLTTAFSRTKRRKSALLFVAAAFLLVGNGMSVQKAARCAMNQVNPAFCYVGEIDEIEKENRVWLRGVLCDGERLHRRALVTLMTNEGEEGKEVFCRTRQFRERADCLRQANRAIPAA